MTVLLIEDDHDLGMLLQDILAGHPNVVASLARHPSAIPREVAPDVIVSDLFGSWYDRASSVRQLEDLGRRFPGVPIVLVTAHWQVLADRAMLPVDAVMTKPFDVDALAQLVLSFDKADKTRPPVESRSAVEA